MMHLPFLFLFSIVSFNYILSYIYIDSVDEMMKILLKQYFHT